MSSRNFLSFFLFSSAGLIRSPSKTNKWEILEVSPSLVFPFCHRSMVPIAILARWMGAVSGNCSWFFPLKALIPQVKDPMWGLCQLLRRSTPTVLGVWGKDHWLSMDLWDLRWASTMGSTWRLTATAPGGVMMLQVSMSLCQPHQLSKYLTFLSPVNSSLSP